MVERARFGSLKLTGHCHWNEFPSTTWSPILFDPHGGRSQEVLSKHGATLRETTKKDDMCHQREKVTHGHEGKRKEPTHFWGSP